MGLKIDCGRSVKTKQWKQPNECKPISWTKFHREMISICAQFFVHSQCLFSHFKNFLEEFFSIVIKIQRKYFYPGNGKKQATRNQSIWIHYESTFQDYSSNLSIIIIVTGSHNRSVIILIREERKHQKLKKNSVFGHIKPRVSLSILISSFIPLINKSHSFCDSF